MKLLKVAKNVDALDPAVSNDDLEDPIGELEHGGLLRRPLVDDDGIRVRVRNGVVLEEKVSSLVDVFAVELEPGTSEIRAGFETAGCSNSGRSFCKEVIEGFLKKNIFMFNIFINSVSNTINK